AVPAADPPFRGLLPGDRLRRNAGEPAFLSLRRRSATKPVPTGAAETRKLLRALTQTHVVRSIFGNGSTAHRSDADARSAGIALDDGCAPRIVLGDVHAVVAASAVTSVLAGLHAEVPH